MTTPHPMKSSAEVLGSRLLKDVEREEGSLEALLKDLRNLHPLPETRTGIPPLDRLIPNTKTISISGRNLALLHHLLYHQIHTLTGTIALLDLTSTFSPSHLSSLTPSELSHIHIFRCTKTNLHVTLQGVEEYMMSCVGSRGREWLGTIVFGGSGGDVNFGWRGGLRVERMQEGEGFAYAVSLEEAVEERRRRRDGDDGKVRGGRWKVMSDTGEYSWRLS